MSTFFVSIIAAVMTFTVQSKSSVSAEGSFPYDMSTEYGCTYQKGTVRAGDTATLWLDNMGGIALEKIELSLHSNKTAGAGEINVMADGLSIAQKSGTMKDWTGSYDSENNHLVEVMSGLTTKINRLQIRVVGTANSLYIDKFIITYRLNPAYSVRLMDGVNEWATLTDEGSGVGVLLPRMANSEEWQFVGWSVYEVWVAHTTPEYLPAETRFFPKSDCTLWALYQKNDAQPIDYVADLESGTYLYAYKDLNLALRSDTTSGQLDFAVLRPEDEREWFNVTFNATCDSATIQHAPTGTYIGYSGTRLSETASVWTVYHQGNKTAFYMRDKGKEYVLFYNVGGENAMKAALVYATPSTAPTGLIVARQDAPEPYFSCHQESKEAMETLQTDPHETVVRIGWMELHIHNGKKYLRWRN